MRINVALFLSVACLVMVAAKPRAETRYPIPHRLYPGRPPPDPRCTSLATQPFCDAGINLTSFQDDDVIELYHMLADTAFDPSRNYTPPQHSGLGIRNLNTSRNYTLHVYRMFGTKSSQPLPQADGTLLRCNLGASCLDKTFTKSFMRGIAERHMVARTTGKIFNLFTKWVRQDNNSVTDFDVFTAWREPGGVQWTEGWDCGDFVRRCFSALYELGVRFLPGFTPRYWFNALYTEEPVWVGDDTTIFGPDGNTTMAQELVYFYKHGGILLPVFRGYTYLYYNREYWRADLTNNTQHLELFTKHFPLPGYEDFV